MFLIYQPSIGEIDFALNPKHENLGTTPRALRQLFFVSDHPC